MDGTYIEIGSWQRVYRLRNGDVFCVDVNTFLKNSTLWSHEYQIMGTDKIKRKKWWQFWKPKYNTFVKLKYLGE